MVHWTMPNIAAHPKLRGLDEPRSQQHSPATWSKLPQLPTHQTGSSPGSCSLATTSHVKMASLIECLDESARRQPHALLFAFHHGHGSETERHTYREFAERTAR